MKPSAAAVTTLLLILSLIITLCHSSSHVKKPEKLVDSPLLREIEYKKLLLSRKPSPNKTILVTRKKVPNKSRLNPLVPSENEEKARVMPTGSSPPEVAGTENKMKVRKSGGGGKGTKETPASDRMFFPPYKYPLWGMPYGIYSNGGFVNPGLFPFVPGGPGFPPYDGIFGNPFGGPVPPGAGPPMVPPGPPPTSAPPPPPPAAAASGIARVATPLIAYGQPPLNPTGPPMGAYGPGSPVAYRSPPASRPPGTRSKPKAKPRPKTTPMPEMMTTDCGCSKHRPPSNYRYEDPHHHHNHNQQHYRKPRPHPPPTTPTPCPYHHKKPESYHHHAPYSPPSTSAPPYSQPGPPYYSPPPAAAPPAPTPPPYSPPPTPAPSYSPPVMPAYPAPAPSYPAPPSPPPYYPPPPTPAPYTPPQTPAPTPPYSPPETPAPPPQYSPAPSPPPSYSAPSTPAPYVTPPASPSTPAPPPQPEYYTPAPPAPEMPPSTPAPPDYSSTPPTPPPYYPPSSSPAPYTEATTTTTTPAPYTTSTTPAPYYPPSTPEPGKYTTPPPQYQYTPPPPTTPSPSPPPPSTPQPYVGWHHPVHLNYYPMPPDYSPQNYAPAAESKSYQSDSSNSLAVYTPPPHSRPLHRLSRTKKPCKLKSRPKVQKLFPFEYRPHPPTPTQPPPPPPPRSKKPCPYKLRAQLAEQQQMQLQQQMLSTSTTTSTTTPAPAMAPPPPPPYQYQDPYLTSGSSQQGMDDQGSILYQPNPQEIVHTPTSVTVPLPFPFVLEDGVLKPQNPGGTEQITYKLDMDSDLITKISTPVVINPSSRDHLSKYGQRARSGGLAAAGSSSHPQVIVLDSSQKRKDTKTKVIFPSSRKPQQSVVVINPDSNYDYEAEDDPPVSYAQNSFDLFGSSPDYGYVVTEPRRKRPRVKLPKTHYESAVSYARKKKTRPNKDSKGYVLIDKEELEELENSADSDKIEVKYREPDKDEEDVYSPPRRQKKPKKRPSYSEQSDTGLNSFSAIFALNNEGISNLETPKPKSAKKPERLYFDTYLQEVEVDEEEEEEEDRK